MLLWSMRLLVFLVAAGSLPGAHALQVRDDRGVQVTLDRTPRRIVSLLPSLTETVCALGECARLVGVDRYSNHPASVRSLPQLGGGIDPQIEAVVALKPDLVLMATSSRAVARLESLGLKVLALEPRRSADVQRVIAALGQVLDVPDAQRVWRAIDAEVVAAAKALPPRARGMRVYFEVNRGPYAAGQSSFIGEVLSRMGLGNIMTPELGPFPKINPEYVVRADPDLILISQRNAQGLEQRPGWAGIRALRDRRVCLFNSEQADVLVRAGPRMAEAARLIVACVSDKVK
ncbi:MAG: helical backbone metal receptor [Burkholderiaceae bacterium]|nr:helical backbone metal receptor [Burkholderiaceae bacterium]